MPKAVRYDEFGGIDVLRVDEVQRPVPGSGQVLVRVKAAGINPRRSSAPSRRSTRSECGRKARVLDWQRPSTELVICVGIAEG